MLITYFSYFYKSIIVIIFLSIFRKIIDNPFAFPSDRLFIAYYKWLQARKKLNTKSEIKKHSRCSRKSLIDNNIFDEYTGPTAITDIDPDYYTDLNGRAIIEKFSSKKYIDQTRKVLRGKIIAGYYRDECIKIDQEFANEHQEIINIEVDNLEKNILLICKIFIALFYININIYF